MLRNTPNTEALIVEYGFLDTASDANIVVPFYNANEVVYMIAYRFDI